MHTFNKYLFLLFIGLGTFIPSAFSIGGNDFAWHEAHTRWFHSECEFLRTLDKNLQKEKRKAWKDAPWKRAATRITISRDAYNKGAPIEFIDWPCKIKWYHQVSLH